MSAFDVGVHFVSHPETFSVRIDHVTDHGEGYRKVEKPYFRLRVGGDLCLFLSPAQMSKLWHTIAEHPAVLEYDRAQSAAIAEAPIRAEEYDADTHHNLEDRNSAVARRGRE